MRVCLYEDRAEFLEPLSLTRPVFDLWCGLSTLGRKLWQHLRATPRVVLVRPHLVELNREQHPQIAVNDRDWLRADRLLLVNGRWLAAGDLPELDQGACVGTIGDEVAYVLLDHDLARELTPDDFPLQLQRWRRVLPERSAGGRLITFPWDLVECNGPEIARDFAGPIGAGLQHAPSTTLALVGPAELLRVDPSARIDPFVVADTTAGPVVIAERAVVTAFTRLEGPCYVGPGSHVLGAKIRAGTTLGPECRIGGEVEASIVHGHSNKYHDGFLGHSYVGEWVNLGAGTHNSDLRNDYGPVDVTVCRQRVATGQKKVGCFLGDHTKTALGTLLNTGTSVGVFCNLLPAGRLAAKYVPSFMTWGAGGLTDNVSLEKLLATADQVMRRRGQSLTAAHARLYRHVLEETAADRRWALRDAAERGLRHSA